MTTNTITKIIVEGPDCSGKSTLVERLKNNLHWDSKSLHHKKGNQFYRYLQEYSNQEYIVFDRSHYSEEVYSNLWRGGSPFSEEEKSLLDKLSKHNTMIIFSMPSEATLEARYKKRGFKQQISLSDLKKSYKIFNNELSGNNHVVYRSKNFDELDNLIDNIKKELAC